MLALATIGFAVNVCAGAADQAPRPMYRDLGTPGDRADAEVALFVAVPFSSGSWR